jgi:hypothetical protein
VLPPRQGRPPHPQPLSPEYGGEGSRFPAARPTILPTAKRWPPPAATTTSISSTPPAASSFAACADTPPRSPASPIRPTAAPWLPAAPGTARTAPHLGAGNGEMVAPHPYLRRVRLVADLRPRRQDPLFGIVGLPHRRLGPGDRQGAAPLRRAFAGRAEEDGAGAGRKHARRQRRRRNDRAVGGGHRQVAPPLDRPDRARPQRAGSSAGLLSGRHAAGLGERARADGAAVGDGHRQGAALARG